MNVHRLTQPGEENLEYLKALGEVPDWLNLEWLMDWQKLNLGSSGVSEAGLAHLVDLPRLQSLYMYGIAVGEVGLDCLKKMPKLKLLYVTSSLLSESDERVLVRALPRLKIHRSW